jgi:hypothetical protein
MDNVVLVNSDRLEVGVPATVPAGSYHVRVVNPNGSKAIGPQIITISQPSLFLPVVFKPGTSPITANWHSLGYDAGHTGYNLEDQGASRYSLAWTKNLAFPVASPMHNVAVDNSLLVATIKVSDGVSAVVAFHIGTGEEVWRQQISGELISPPTIGNGVVYVTQDQDPASLFAFDVKTGDRYWQTALSMHSSHSAAYYQPTVADGRIFLGDNLVLASFNAYTGKRLWQTSWGQNILWTPAYQNGMVYAWSSMIFNPHLASNGEGPWTLPVGDSGATSVISGNRAILDGQTKLVGVNLDNKTVAWSFSGDYGGQMAATADGVVYSLNGGVLEVRSIVNGALLWDYAAGPTLLNAPVIAGDYVYVTSEQETFVINRWTHQLEWYVTEGGWLAVANGYLFITDKDGVIYAYRAEEE